MESICKVNKTNYTAQKNWVSAPGNLNWKKKLIDELPTTKSRSQRINVPIQQSQVDGIHCVYVVIEG